MQENKKNIIYIIGDKELGSSLFMKNIVENNHIIFLDDINNLPKDISDCNIISLKDHNTIYKSAKELGIEPLSIDTYIVDNEKIHKALKNAKVVPVKTYPKMYRNQLCPYGSGLKFKKCCIDKDI
jgi:hypothetical protein